MSRDDTRDIALHCRRRQQLLDKLGDGLLLLPTAPETRRNGDVHHEYRPGSDFHFLTGFGEPEAVLACWRTGKGRHRTVLFVRPRDPQREIWDGRRHGVAGARSRFGADEAHPVGELWKQLPKLLEGCGTLFHRLGADAQFDHRLLAVLAHRAMAAKKSFLPAHPAIVDPVPAIGAMRLRKDPEDLAAMRQAAAITAAGHLAAMGAVRAGMHEYEAQAVVEASFRSMGSPRNGYPSIVASGANACVLHYHDNDRRMRAGDLLLIDAGAEFGGQTGDITRTFPVSGTFTPPQAAVYGAVLDAQLAGIASARSGAPADVIHRTCVRKLTAGLVALGVLRGSVDRLVAKQAYKPWYMHGTSHWLGRDVHDVGSYQDEDGTQHPLRPGMVLTVEPGLYFQPDDRKVPSDLRGIGIRIEDDVLVTGRGPVVLTSAAPKSVADVEAACRRPAR